MASINAFSFAPADVQAPIRVRSGLLGSGHWQGGAASMSSQGVAPADPARYLTIVFLQIQIIRSCENEHGVEELPVNCSGEPGVIWQRSAVLRSYVCVRM